MSSKKWQLTDLLQLLLRAPKATHKIAATCDHLDRVSSHVGQTSKSYTLDKQHYSLYKYSQVLADTLKDSYYTLKHKLVATLRNS